jgi:hypothetical protein
MKRNEIKSNNVCFLNYFKELVKELSTKTKSSKEILNKFYNNQILTILKE